MSEYEDYPLEELAPEMSRLIAEGADVNFKWTCDACGERVTASQSNVAYTAAEHTDCPVTPGYVTDTKTKGGNYLVRRYAPGIAIDGDTQRRQWK